MPIANSIGKKLVWGLNLFWILAAAAIVLPPYFASVGSPIAGFLYMLCKPTCHQLPHRSFFLWGHQMGVCARCTGIWASLMLFGFIATPLLYLRKLPQIRARWLAIAIVPLVLDGATQFLGLRESTNEFRMITGIIAGAAIVWFVYPRLWDADK